LIPHVELPEPRPFVEAFAALKDEKNLTVDDVYWEMRQRFPESKDSRERGASLSTLQKMAAGAQHPTVLVMERVAVALGSHPHHFIEYRLAKARERIDERVVGLDEAWQTLSQIEEALRAAPQSRAATRAARTASSQRPSEGTQPGDRRLREAGGRGDA
jgi:hypothetical protein